MSRRSLKRIIWPVRGQVLAALLVVSISVFFSMPLLAQDEGNDSVQKVSFDFKGMSLDSVAAALSMVLGKPVAVDPSLRDLRVDLYLKEGTAEEAVNRLCRKYRLRMVNQTERLRLESVDRPVAILDFKQTPLVDVIRLFSELAGKNVVANKDILEMPITLYMENVPPREAIEAMCKQNGLWYREDPYYIRIMRLDDYARDLSFNYEGEVRVMRLEHAPAATVADTLATLMEERIVFVSPETVSNYGHVGYGADDVGSFSVEEPSSSEGAGSMVEGAPGVEVKSGELTAGQIGRLKEKARQTETGKGTKPGTVQALALKKQIPRAYLTVYPRDNLLLAFSADKRLLEQIAELVARMDTPVRQVLLEGKILQVNLGDDFQSVFDWDVHRQGREGAANARRDVPDYHLPKHGWWAEGTLPGLDATSMVYEYVDRNFLLRLEMLKKENRLKTIGTPMVLAASNSLAEFFVGEERLIVNDWSSQKVGTRSLGEGVFEDIIRVLPSYTTQQIGTKFEILPLINDDGLVTLRLLMETQQVRPQAYSIQVPDEQGNPATFFVDSVITSSLENTLVVKDGQALAIGGLVNEEESVNEEKVPLLGDIPGLGFFFKKKGKKKIKTETVLIIIPHVIAKADAGQQVTRKTMRDLSDHPVTRGEERNILDYDPRHRQLRSRDEPTTNPAEYIFDGSVRQHYPAGPVSRARDQEGKGPEAGESNETSFDQ